MSDPIDYSLTQRILLLIDLHPILFSNPSSYLNAIRAAAEAILTIPSLSSSLFSFKFFYSSLPLILYPTKTPLKLKFHQPETTLTILTEALTSLPKLEDRVDETVRCCSKALLFDSALRQVLHDYVWESEELDSGMDFGVVRSNLVIVLSPVGGSIEFMRDFMDVEKDDELLSSVDKFVVKFGDVFGHVRDAYCRNDIHLAWINVKTEMQCRDWDCADESYDLFRNGLKSMGWGFCSTDSVVLGSALFPTGLIYPVIGLSSDVRNCESSSKKCRAQLNLEITDVSGKPIECRCCDLELHKTSLSCRKKLDFGLRDKERISWRENDISRESFFDQACAGTIKLHIKAVMKYSECEKMKGRMTDIGLVHERARKSGKHEVKVSGEFYGDKVLKMLRFEMGDCKETDSPIWNILLSYMYKERHWGIVSLTDSSGNSCNGILKPFTFDSAFLFIMDSVSWPKIEAEGPKITESVKDANVNSHTLTVDGHSDSKCNTGPLSQDDERKDRKNSRLLKRLDWSTLCKMAYESSRIDIGDAYFTASFDKTKKLKFLSCWMKQIKKCSSNYYIACQLEQHYTLKESNDRLLQSSEDGERPIFSPASMEENSHGDRNRTQDAAARCSIPETPEDFLSNLTKRIQDGLDNEGLDLGAFAERIVNSTIQSLRVTYENEDGSRSGTSEEPHTDTVTNKIACELTSLLLTDPQDKIAKHTNIENNTEADHSEAIKRRYELQIFFRMEIIRSEVATGIAESMKHKFVKQICMLLERVQCHLEGGFLGHWNLDSYVAKLLKARYSHDLEDLLHQIYTEMDLLLLSEEDENLNFRHNSEDSSQSFRERLGREEFGETKSILGSASAENKSARQLRNNNLDSKGNNSMSHMLKLAKAKEERERARRFSSFTSWMPDLQRVWVPKHQTQLTKSQSDLSRKHFKRPSRQCVSLDMVFETPESTNKKPCSRRSLESPSSVPKALFQD